MRYDEAFFRGRKVCGAEAFTYWMQSLSHRADPSGKQDKTTPSERLIAGDAEQVAKVNKEIQTECRRALANVAEWRKKSQASRTPSMWITLASRAPGRITPEILSILRETQCTLDRGDKASGYIGWMGTPGANGSNVHGYPPLERVAQPEPHRPVKYVNCQGHGYSLGASTSSRVVNTCIVAACACRVFKAAVFDSAANAPCVIASKKRSELSAS